MEGPLCLAECEEYKGQFEIHPSGAYADCKCINCLDLIYGKEKRDHYEQGTQSVEIDEFTEELLNFSKKDLTITPDEQSKLMMIDDHTVIGDQENYNAMMHLLKEKQVKTN
jgi:hypothetical protein